jgi:hypothetical protein
LAHLKFELNTSKRVKEKAGVQYQALTQKRQLKLQEFVETLFKKSATISVAMDETELLWTCRLSKNLFLERLAQQDQEFASSCLKPP